MEVPVWCADSPNIPPACSSPGAVSKQPAATNLADLLHSAGRTEEAMPHLKQAVSIYAAIDTEAGPLQPEIWELAKW
jgi:hypothetical protein